MMQLSRGGGGTRWGNLDAWEYVTERKFTPQVKKLKCWLEDLVVEQDYWE